MTSPMNSSSTNITNELYFYVTAMRAKLMTQAAWSKVRRQHISSMYPQPEGTLGEALSSNGKELGYQSDFGKISSFDLKLTLCAALELVIVYNTWLVG